MLMCSVLSGANVNQSGAFWFTSQNVTVNEQTGNINVEPISITTLIEISVIVSVALALCMVVGVKVLGSGVSGSVIPIIFMVTILTGVFSILSGLSYGLITSIPIIGFPIYFSLIIMYIVGIASLGVGTGGD
jgi:hypothetical protein